MPDLLDHDVNWYKNEWAKDVEARRSWHAMMNFHHLMYKGIQLLNYTYSRETLEQMGLHIHVPRTFTTIETIRSSTNRDIDIVCHWTNLKAEARAQAMGKFLTGEWARSESNNQKNYALADALEYGSGYLLRYFAEEKEMMPVFKMGKEEKGNIEQEEQTVYEGFKLKCLDPYKTFPDRRAQVWEHGQAGSPQRVWYYDMWDIDVWKEHAKKKGYNVEGLEPGGYLYEFDYIRRYLDAIYLQNTYLNLRTRDQGTLVAGNIYELPKMDTANMIMVLECFENDRYQIFTGSNWTVAEDTENPNPLKKIPITAVKDVFVPHELEGIGEAEIIRWQQYEENKIHNLSYLQLLMNTVNRYAIVEELLKDPVEARMGNPLKNIRLKYMPGVKIGDAVQAMPGQKIDYPQQFLDEVKNIGQTATGVTDFSSGASDTQPTQTLGQSELMSSAGNTRILDKITEIENRCIVPILKDWMKEMPYLYTEELEYSLNDGQGSVKFLPINRKSNSNPHFVAKYAVQEGVHDPNVKTVSDVFLSEGYQDIVFIDDLLERYDIEIRTSLTGLLRQNLIQEYGQVITMCQNENTMAAKMNQAPVWDINKLISAWMKQFTDIITDPEEYKLPPPQPAAPPGVVPQGGAPAPGGQPGGMPPPGAPPMPPSVGMAAPAPQPGAVPGVPTGGPPTNLT